jgi:hypothetical protein
LFVYVPLDVRWELQALIADGDGVIDADRADVHGHAEFLSNHAEMNHAPKMGKVKYTMIKVNN